MVILVKACKREVVGPKVHYWVSCLQLFLPPSNCQTQSQLDEITEWTRQNLMKLNEAKSNYMIFKRTKSNFVTRPNLNGTVLDQLSTTKIKGIWIKEDLS
jgi:hypothetical protein